MGCESAKPDKDGLNAATTSSAGSFASFSAAGPSSVNLPQVIKGAPVLRLSKTDEPAEITTSMPILPTNKAKNSSDTDTKAKSTAPGGLQATASKSTTVFATKAPQETDV